MSKCVKTSFYLKVVMNRDKSQKEIVIEKLDKDGFVNRNWCLRKYISRLSAIIYELKEEGWEFETKRGKGDDNDYYYHVRTRPPKETDKLF